MQDHRDWVERVCGLVGAEARLPIWQRDRRAVMDELLDTGFRAVIVAVRATAGDLPDLGLALLSRRRGCRPATDPAGSRCALREAGERSLRDGVWFTDVSLA